MIIAKPKLTVESLLHKVASAGPILALSVRQPFAFAIMSGAKNIENRGWTPNIILPAVIAVHASCGKIDREEVENVRRRLSDAGITMPDPESFQKGMLLGFACIDSVLPPFHESCG